VTQHADIKIFISYGRGDATLFVDRLEKDLKANGFSVFRDKTDLKAGIPWDDQVEEALKQSNILIAVLTPHAVRSERHRASICLEELHTARSNEPPIPIVPVMLMPCKPPFIIARLQYLDFGHADEDDRRYKEALNRLLEMVSAVANGAAVPDNTLDFEPLDFSPYLRRKTHGFGGRSWLVADLFNQLSEATPAVLVIGEPGWGKTAFAGNLVDLDPEGRLLAAHFCRKDRPDTIDGRRFVQNICAMAALRSEAYKSRLHGLVEQHPRRAKEEDGTVLFERLFIEPLIALDPAILGQSPLYLLVDGLDEADASAPDSIAELLRKSLDLFPDWLKLVATARERSNILQTISGTVVRLDRHDPRNLADVRQLITDTLQEPGTVVPLPNALDHMVRAIEEKADGIAYYATLLANLVKMGGMDVTAVAAVPREVIAFHRTILDRRFGPDLAQWSAAREILEMAMATPAALPIAVAAGACGDATEYATRGVVDSLSDWLEIDDEAINMRHALAKEFFELKSTPYHVNAAVGATRLVEYSSRLSHPAEQLARFFRQHETAWLASSHDPARLADRLLTLYERRFTYWDEGNFLRTPGGQINVQIGGESENFYLPTGNGMIVRGLPASDRTLLEVTAPAVDAAVLTRLIELVFSQAAARFEASYLPLRKDLYDLHYYKKEPLNDRNAATMRTALNIAQFGLLMIRNLADIRPEWRPQLDEALTRARRLFDDIGRIDGSLASYIPPLREWFVPVCDSICGYAYALSRKLTDQPELRLWA
jgi:hypothetical protein